MKVTIGEKGLERSWQQEFPKTTDEEKNKYVCERLGICWCEPEYFDADVDRCPKCEARYSRDREFTYHPDFSTDPVALLKEMKRRDDWNDFYKWASDHERILDYNSQGTVFIKIAYILDDTGRLLDVVVKWFEEKELKKQEKKKTNQEQLSEKYECNLCSCPCRVEITFTDDNLPEYLETDNARFRNRVCLCLELESDWRKIEG